MAANKVSWMKAKTASKKYYIEKAFNVTLEHGEGPIWDDIKKCFHWVDLLKGDFYTGELEKGTCCKTNVGQALGVVGLSHQNTAVMALADGFGKYDFGSKTLKLIPPISDTLNPDVRFNDGTVGPDGRFYAGTMQWQGKKGLGKLFRLSSDGLYEVLEENHTVPNGMGWNMAKNTFFMVDTGHHCIYAFDFSEGELSRKRVFKKFGNDVHPDGMAVDSNNHFWIAMWGGGKIVHLDEKGNYVEEIPLPIKYPTSCCFGGENMDLLLVTSSRLLLTPHKAKNDSLSGCCFIMETEYKGQTENRFGDLR